jgi:hypothetical protein
MSMAKRVYWIAGIVLVVAILAFVLYERHENRGSIELVELSPGKSLLLIETRQWGGLLGPDGFIGYIHITYMAALEGSGPVFTNPHFSDNPQFRCVGTITMDRKHNHVIIKMRRIQSKPGEQERTVSHPANGTYAVGVVRAPKSSETWF